MPSHVDAILIRMRSFLIPTLSYSAISSFALALVFAVSKETAQLEHQAYELRQKVDVTAEAKAVLDSWIRYEGQVKARQQQEIADAVIAKVEKELENPKVLDQILKQAVSDVEKILQQQGKQQQSQKQSEQ